MPANAIINRRRGTRNNQRFVRSTELAASVGQIVGQLLDDRKQVDRLSKDIPGRCPRSCRRIYREATYSRYLSRLESSWIHPCRPRRLGSRPINPTAVSGPLERSEPVAVRWSVVNGLEMNMTKKSAKTTKAAAIPLSTSENPNEVSVGHGVIDCYDVYVVRSSGKPDLSQADSMPWKRWKS